MIRKRLSVLIRTVLLGAAFPCFGCTTVVAGRKAAAGGKVIVGHNEDDATRSFSLSILPADEPDPEAADLPGKPARCLWIRFPERDFCDSFLNGHGVVVTSDAAPSKDGDMEALSRGGQLTHGGIGRRLRRVTARYARSAAEGARIAVSLLERYGYASPGRIYVIADRDEAWILHAAAGKHYCARRLADDEAVCIPNSYILDAVDPSDIAPEDLVSYAEEKGWHSPSGGRPFSLCRAYGVEGRGWLSERGFDARQRIGQKLLAGKDPEPGPLPFSVRPGMPVTYDKIREILRSHMEDTPSEKERGPERYPHGGEDAGICRGSTLASFLVEFGDAGGLPATLWLAMGRPCLSAYTPFWTDSEEIPPCCGAGGTSWETHRRMQREADADYFRHASRLRPQIQALEAEIRERTGALARPAGERAQSGYSPGTLGDFSDEMARIALAWAENALR